MRMDIVHAGAGELTYEIRNIIGVAERLQRLGVKVHLENIGDPVAKGERVPEWFKGIVVNLALCDETYGYCPTQGVKDTREFLAELNNQNGNTPIGPEDIIFFNGLGDAIAKVYGLLRPGARVLTPSPTYTTHSSAEAAHAGLSPLTYSLNPRNHWYPDPDEVRKKVEGNPSVAGILIINPDNPTGAVFPEEILREIVSIAREFQLFVIADEIYRNLVFNGHKTRSLGEVIGDVPGLSMKGISKVFPWPGARCGWIEVYNREQDPLFAAYIKSILNAKMLEVCSTTLPQKAIPHILQHPEYPAFLKNRLRRYEKFSRLACDRLRSIPGIHVNPANGAFYMSVVFEEGRLNHTQALPISDPEVRTLVEGLTSAPDISLDKRFVYYLLASTGLCVVPLSSFSTALQGFRITLLEPDETNFRGMLDTLSSSIMAYLTVSC